MSTIPHYDQHSHLSHIVFKNNNYKLNYQKARLCQLFLIIINTNISLIFNNVSKFDFINNKITTRSS